MKKDLTLKDFILSRYLKAVNDNNSALADVLFNHFVRVQNSRKKYWWEFWK